MGREKLFDTSMFIINKLNTVPGTFITGSAAIGGFDKDTSDVDVVVPINRDSILDNIWTVLAMQAWTKESSGYSNGIKFRRHDAITINIVRLHPFDYCAWLFATNLMREQDTITDRNLRHRVFEAAILWFKLANNGGNYVTVDGAECYYLNHKPKSISEEYNALRSRIQDDVLPF